MMKTGEKGLNLIKKFEGFRDKEYICPAGKPTIGYGHVILPSEHFPSSITKEEAEILLKNDLVSREKSLNILIKVVITQNQFDALISLIYNIGIENFKQSTLLKFINDKLFDKIPDQFRRWKYINKVISKGLLNRREEEIKLWLA
jgi:lysozyme